MEHWIKAYWDTLMLFSSLIQTIIIMKAANFILDSPNKGMQYIHFPISSNYECISRQKQ